MQKAYSCIDCGVINVFKTKNIDGLSCMKCNGPLVPMGEAITSKEHTRQMTMTVNVDTKGIDQAINKCEVLNEQLSKAQEILSNPYFVQAFQIDEQFDQFNELVLKPVVEARNDIVDALIHSMGVNNG